MRFDNEMALRATREMADMLRDALGPDVTVIQLPVVAVPEQLVPTGGLSTPVHDRHGWAHV